MNFLIDANLPRRLVYIFRERGYQAIHTLDLPHANITKDSEILQYADMGEYTIVTKDSDFITTFWLNNQPKKLFLISTGNISNKELEALLVANLNQIITDLSNYRFIELSNTHVIVHV